MARTTILYFFFPEIGAGGPPPSVAGYGLGGPTLIDVFPITGLAGVPDPVIQTTRQTH